MIFYYETKSNAAPLFLDTNDGFIEADDPMSALHMVVDKYNHPGGLYAAMIEEYSEQRKLLALYLSSRAATSMAAGRGTHKWRDGRLYVDGIRQQQAPESFILKEYGSTVD